MLFGSCHPRGATSVSEKNAQHLARPLPYDPDPVSQIRFPSTPSHLHQHAKKHVLGIHEPSLNANRFDAASQRCILCWGLALSRTICSNSTIRAVPLLPLTGPVVPHNRQRAAQQSSTWISTRGTTLRSLCLHRPCECLGLDTLYSSSCSLIPKSAGPLCRAFPSS